MCLSCRQMKPKRELVRVVCNKEGVITLDQTGRAAGRGAYVCLAEACVEHALKSRAFERALSRKLPPQIAEELLSVAREGHQTGE